LDGAVDFLLRHGRTRIPTGDSNIAADSVNAADGEAARGVHRLTEAEISGRYFGYDTFGNYPDR
jgi:hypothetical protein